MKKIVSLLVVIGVLLIGFIGFNGYNLITGNQLVSTFLVITQEETAVCNITFTTDWTLASFPCMSNNIQTSIFFENISNDSIDNIRSYDATDASDPWKIYKPDLPSYVVQDLTSISRSSGYWILFNENTSFYRNASLQTPTLISVVPGWNLIGYPSQDVQDIYVAFNAAIPNYEIIRTYNVSDSVDPWKEWTYNTSISSDQDLNATVPPQAYWINMYSSEVIVIG